MILTIAGANFSGANIGTNTNVGITLTKGNGVSGSKVSSLTLEKNQVVSTATVIATGLSLQTGYENLVVTVTMTGTGDVSRWFSNGTVTIPSGTKITGNIKITASATAISGGETGGDSEGDSEQPGTGGDTPVINHPQPSGESIPQNGIVTEDMFVVLENTWINGSETQLDQKLDSETGNTVGYFTAYLPIDISGYTNIDMTAQTNAATYYQFFKKDGSWSLAGTRIKIDKGTTSDGISIPSGAKYLLVASHRSNSTDAAAVDGYLKYFPQSIKIY